MYLISFRYNGMPNGCHDDEFPWAKNTESPLDSKFLYGMFTYFTYGFIILSHLYIKY